MIYQYAEGSIGPWHDEFQQGDRFCRVSTDDGQAWSEPTAVVGEIDSTGGPSGMEAIPADMPNAPHGDQPLVYDLPTFNALVAANTTMQTEIASAERREAILHKQVEQLENALALQQRHAGEAGDMHAERKRLIEKLSTENKDLQADGLFYRDQRDELQRKLDRSLGYMDRVLDEEASLRAPSTQTVPAERPAVGPNLGDVPRAVRRDEHGRTAMPYAYEGTTMRVHPSHVEPFRRY